MLLADDPPDSRQRPGKAQAMSLAISSASTSLPPSSHPSLIPECYAIDENAARRKCTHALTEHVQGVDAKN